MPRCRSAFTNALWRFFSFIAGAIMRLAFSIHSVVIFTEHTRKRSQRNAELLYGYNCGIFSAFIRHQLAFGSSLVSIQRSCLGSFCVFHNQTISSQIHERQNKWTAATKKHVRRRIGNTPSGGIKCLIGCSLLLIFLICLIMLFLFVSDFFSLILSYAQIARVWWKKILSKAFTTNIFLSRRICWEW